VKAAIAAHSYSHHLLDSMLAIARDGLKVMYNQSLSSEVRRAKLLRRFQNIVSQGQALDTSLFDTTSQWVAADVNVVVDSRDKLIN